MRRDVRFAHRLRRAHDYLEWVSTHASGAPSLAGAIARAGEDLDHVEAVLRSSEHTSANAAVADTLLSFMEQRLQDLGADVQTER